MVGPNGSGKSNVIDAMLFVFGKRAKQVKFCYRFSSFCFNWDAVLLSLYDLFFDAFLMFAWPFVPAEVVLYLIVCR